MFRLETYEAPPVMLRESEAGRRARLMEEILAREGQVFSVADLEKAGTGTLERLAASIRASADSSAGPPPPPAVLARRPDR